MSKGFNLNKFPINHQMKKWFKRIFPIPSIVMLCSVGFLSAFLTDAENQSITLSEWIIFMLFFFVVFILPFDLMWWVIKGVIRYISTILHNHHSKTSYVSDKNEISEKANNRKTNSTYSNATTSNESVDDFQSQTTICNNYPVYQGKRKQHNLIGLSNEKLADECSSNQLNVANYQALSEENASKREIVTNKSSTKNKRFLSQYSSMPRYYTINGIQYDIDNPQDILQIPVFDTIIDINGEKYGMDSILRKHSHDSYLKNKAIYNAARDKLDDYSQAGYYFETKEEQEQHKKWEEKRRVRDEQERKTRELHYSFAIDDMHCFIDIPFEWSCVMRLTHSHDKAWFMLNKNNQFIALHYIKQISDLIADSQSYISGISGIEICTEEIDFGYPVPMKNNSLPNTYVECLPFTQTGKTSKYPVVLHFSSSEIIKNGPDNKYECQIHPYLGHIYIMQDGNIGKAEIHFIKNSTRFSIGLYGVNLIIKRVDSNFENIYKYTDSY